ncbi:MAG: hypothetical protein H6506_02090 [Calditrichaeota bacterium]|nr:hypothetical protein [Calditrichota bacterium]MCB9391423.1 hypothetical protein [Calditrichota bacterium]
MSVIRIFLIASLAGMLVSCDQGGGDPVVHQVEFQVVTTSVHLQEDSPHTQVFRTWGEWLAFWAEHPECGDSCVASPPYVDFNEEMIAGLFWGLETETGWDLSDRIEAIERSEDNTYVRLREQPMSESFPAEGYAYLFVKFDRADGPVIFTGVVPQ